MLWFVTPAWKRYELSDVCFRQRRQVIDTLGEHGIQARCVVVADDQNLDIAKSYGFDTFERDNEWLGRKFNDGIEYAAANGASRIVPIGSDSWIDPAYFLPLPHRDARTRTGSLYAVVTSDRLGEVAVHDTKGAGPYVFSRYQLAPTFRPAKDELTHGVDGSTVKGLRVAVRWKFNDLHPLQYIGFRGDPHISSYDGLMATWGVAEHRDPWERLATVYPPDLVAAAEEGAPVNAVILSDALDTNGQNARYSEAAKRHGDDPAVLKALVLGKADPAGVMGRFQEASTRHDVGLSIRSAHRVAYEYMQYPTDIYWPKDGDRAQTKVIEAQIAQLVNEADVLHLNNSWVPSDYWLRHPLTSRRMARKPPSLLHHHGSMFRANPAAIMDRARTRQWAQAVSTVDLMRPAPDLLHWLPSAYNIAELQAIGEKYRRPPDGRVRIIHTPTGTVHDTHKFKHTELFVAVIDALIAEGLPIDLVVMRDASNADVIIAKAQADILYDQLNLGYGCNSIEAWGLGKPVISGADEWTLDRMARMWPSIPFEEATTATLKMVIKRMVKSQALREDAAQRGLTHVLRYHDELPALERLAELYHEAIKVKVRPRIQGKAVTFHSSTRRSMMIDGQVVQFDKGIAVVTDAVVVKGLRGFVKERPRFGIEELP